MWPTFCAHAARSSISSRPPLRVIPSVCALLDGDPVAIGAFSHDGWTALHLAGHFGHSQTVELLLDRGADLEVRSRNILHNTPLQATVAGGSAETAALLLAAGADVRSSYEAGVTPLHVAAENGSIEMIRLLLAHGADVAARDDDGRTPLALAQARPHIAAADLLHQHGPTV